MRRAPGPLFEWLVPRAMRDTSSYISGFVFGLLFYGVVFLTALIWATSGPARTSARELLTAFHVEGLLATSIVLLLWSPSRLAQTLAREREVDTLSALRLTGLTGVELALGFLGHALALPLALCALTLPIVLAGAGGVTGPLGPLRSYTVLLLLALVYHLGAALAGLAAKKSQNAGGAAVFGVLFLLGVSGAYKVPHLEPLGLLGPWGAFLGPVPKDDLRFDLPFLGETVPGDLIQVGVLTVLALILLRALARQLAGDRPGLFVGAPAAIALSALGAAVVVVTVRAAPGPLAELTFGRLLVLLLLVAPLALEVPARFMDLVRGAARRDRDDPPLPEERLDPRRLLAGPAIVVVALVAIGLQLPGGDWSVRLAVAGAVLISTWLFAALAVQAARLWTRDKGAPLFFVLVGLVVVWGGPFVSAVGLRELGFGPAVTELPRLINPLYSLRLTCATGSTGGLDPLALAATCAALHAFGALGMGWLVRTGERRVTELADSLVVLPADADDAPGTLERRCPAGHLYAGVWATCPHCPGAVSSAHEG